MNVYSINNKLAVNDYHGCGKVWAAVDKNQVVALRYMSDFAVNLSKAPNWVLSVYKTYPNIADATCTVRYISRIDLKKIRDAAIAAGHPAQGRRGGHISGLRIATQARLEIQNIEREQFRAFRACCKRELSLSGDVLSGMCSCMEFVAIDNNLTKLGGNNE